MATILPHVLKRALSLVISTNEEGKVDDCTTLSPSSTLDTRLGVVIKTPLPISIFEEGKDKDGLSFEGRKNVSNLVVRRGNISTPSNERDIGQICNVKNVQKSSPSSKIHSTKKSNPNNSYGQNRRKKALQTITNVQPPSSSNQSIRGKAFGNGGQASVHFSIKRTSMDRSRTETPEGLKRRHVKEIRASVMKGLKPRCLDDIRGQVGTILDTSITSRRAQNLASKVSNLSIESSRIYKVSKTNSLDLKYDLINHSFGSSSSRSSSSSSGSSSQFLQYFYQQVHSSDSSSINDDEINESQSSEWSYNSSQHSILSQFVAVSPDLTIEGAKTAVGAFVARAIEGEGRDHSFELRQNKAPLTAVGAWVERQMLCPPTRL